jgi:uncharacterized protein (TIGR00369 family)
MTAQDTPPPSITHDELLAQGWEPLQAVDYIELVGQVYFRPDGERMRYGFIAEPRHRNRRSVIHGGVIAAFADRVLALAGRRVNDNLPQATIELSIRFIDAAQIGEFIEATPEVIRKTRSVIFVRSTIEVGSRTVATADGIWKILGPRPPA